MKRGIKWLLVNYPWNAIQTTVHKLWVMWYILKFSYNRKLFWGLIWRGIVHDFSKYSHAEALFFADEIFNLKKLVYGTPEYKESLNKIRPCIEHHYKVNSHHPEHYPNGYADMSHLDKIEMICDWCAACRRHKDKDGNIFKSIDLNQKRFGYSQEDKKWLISMAELLKGRCSSAQPESSPSI